MRLPTKVEALLQQLEGVVDAKDEAVAANAVLSCGVPASEVDLQVLDCFVKADGGVVTREQLQQRLGRNTETDAADGLNATIYRLRRRIERATPQVVPLQSKSRVGYRFKAPLQER